MVKSPINSTVVIAIIVITIFEVLEVRSETAENSNFDFKKVKPTKDSTVKLKFR